MRGLPPSRLAGAWLGLAGLGILCLALACASRSPADPFPTEPAPAKSALPEPRTIKPIVMAHRGFRALAPENTLLAGRKAFEAGAPWWELDVAASSDGVLVVIHDDTLTRTTDAKSRFPSASPWSVYDFSAAQLFSLDAGSWYGASDPFGEIASARVGSSELEGFRGLGIPSLAACLALAKEWGRRVNVEIKDAQGRSCEPWIVEKAVDLIRDQGMVDSVILSSFNLDYLRRARKAEPRLATAAIVDRPPRGDLVALLRELGVQAYNPSIKYLDEGTVRALRAAGFDVNVWTVNTVDDIRKVWTWGATGLITDYPDRALEYLAKGS